MTAGDLDTSRRTARPYRSGNPIARTGQFQRQLRTSSAESIAEADIELFSENQNHDTTKTSGLRSFRSENPTPNLPTVCHLRYVFTFKKMYSLSIALICTGLMSMTSGMSSCTEADSGVLFIVRNRPKAPSRSFSAPASRRCRCRCRYQHQHRQRHGTAPATGGDHRHSVGGAAVVPIRCRAATAGCAPGPRRHQHLRAGPAHRLRDPRRWTEAH